MRPAMKDLGKTIYDIYTEFIGNNPDNPFRNLNKEGVDKVMEYTRLLEKSDDYRMAEIIPLHLIRERKVYYAAVSAGNGSFLDREDYEMYSSADIPEKFTTLNDSPFLFSLSTTSTLPAIFPTISTSSSFSFLI